MFNGADLLTLQSIDRESTADRQRLVKIEQALGEDESLARARQTLEDAQRVMQKHSIHQKDLELEIQGVVSKATASEKRLYSGTIKNPKELSDLQSEIAALKRRRQSLEDDLLEVMIALEEAEAHRDSAQARLTEVEQAWSTKQLELRAERETLSARLQELAGERENLLPRIDQRVLGIYDELWRRKGSLPVAQAKGGACSACGVSISSSTEWKLRQGELIQCNNCERILVRV